MKKIFYYIGVYAFCATVHDIINSVPDYLNAAKKTVRQINQIKNIMDGKEEKEEGFIPKKVVNKIGF